jgi:hypothetical protein
VAVVVGADDGVGFAAGAFEDPPGGGAEPARVVAGVRRGTVVAVVPADVVVGLDVVVVVVATLVVVVVANVDVVVANVVLVVAKVVVVVANVVVVDGAVVAVDPPGLGFDLRGFDESGPDDVVVALAIPGGAPPAGAGSAMAAPPPIESPATIRSVPAPARASAVRRRRFIAAPRWHPALPTLELPSSLR